jgi:hypothetical protein
MKEGQSNSAILRARRLSGILRTPPQDRRRRRSASSAPRPRRSFCGPPRLSDQVLLHGRQSAPAATTPPRLTGTISGGLSLNREASPRGWLPSLVTNVVCHSALPTPRCGRSLHSRPRLSASANRRCPVDQAPGRQPVGVIWTLVDSQGGDGRLSCRARGSASGRCLGDPEWHHRGH